MERIQAGSFRIGTLFNRLIVLVAVLWTALCAGSASYHLFSANRQIENIAHETARESIEKDKIYRLWAARHGGVYVPVTEKTPPNPYLASLRERDIVTPSGRRLTLVNPAYMTRQVHELARDLTDLRGHITSLRPIRPENAPDPWEDRALKAIEAGAQEFGEAVSYQGEPYYRLMLPLRAEHACLKCHAAQGYALGDLRGGISAAIPLAAFTFVAKEHLQSEVKHFGGLWLVGMLGIAATAPFVRRRIEERDRAEEALHRNLELTQSIIDNEPECVKILDADGNLKFMNRAGLSMIEAEDLDAVLGQPIHTLVVPEHRDAFVALTGKVFAGETGSLEFEIVGIRGARRWLETHAVPLRDKTGAVESLLGITRDVTERRQAEQALQQSEERYRTIVSTAKEGIGILDTHNRLTYVNDRITEILGYERDELLGRSVLDFMHPGDHEDHHRQMELRRQGSGALYERRFVHKSGRVVWILLSGVPLRDRDGSFAGAFGMFTDITERKHAEEALRKSEERLREAQRIGMLGSWELETASGSLWWSDEVYEIFGIDRQAQVTFATFLARIHPADRERVKGSIEDAVQRSLSSWQIEYRIELPGGAVRQLYESATVDVDERGLVVRRRGIVQDITERRQAESERQRLEQQLLQAQRIESVGRLAGGVAHDINNMLMPILGYAELLEHRLPPGGGREDLAEIVSGAKRIRDMTRQLLALARKQTLEMVQLDLNAAVSGFTRILQMTFRENIAITVRLAPTALPVLADKSQLEQVIMNLAVNAQDAMPTGGTFSLSTRDFVADSAFAAERPGMSPGRYVQLIAADTGIGMDEDTRLQIFDPFFTTKEAGKGTGLGLATVYGIVKQHGGYIEVSSELGSGTRFTISLPAISTADEAAAEGPDGQAPRGTETVLLVEDQEQVLRLASLMLSKHGYRVLSAMSGREALGIARTFEGAIHLVLSDVIMPDMNGRELYEKLREMRGTIRVLYMSGYPADVISTHGVLESGINFLRKPFGARELAEKVRLVLDGQNGKG